MFNMKCPKWKKCKLYREDSETCFNEGGMYGEKMASCYFDDN